MIVISDKSYSLEELKSISTENVSITKGEQWENDIWVFLKKWFNNDIDYIELKTSGSTGKPKTIRHYKKYMLASAEMTCAHFKLNNNKVALLCLSVKTIGGMMMIIRAFVADMHLIAIKPSSNPLKQIDRTIDFVAMVPFQAQSVFIENPEKWNLIDKVIIGGGIVSDRLSIDIVQSKINAYSTFGMTETISHFALNRIGENEIYSALNDVSLNIDSNNCLLVSASKLGVKNLQTNDIVDLVDEKQFVWLGRKDNAIESGGFKLIPEFIEKKIEHLFKSKFFIGSIKDDLLNNRIVLLVEGNDIMDIDKLKPFLNKYEYPKLVFDINKFVETKNGKVNRKETMKLLIEKQ